MGNIGNMEQIFPICRNNILELARAYCRITGNNRGTLSRKLRGDMRFLDELSKHKAGMTIKKYDENMQWFEHNWPEGHTMPKFHPVFRLY